MQVALYSDNGKKLKNIVLDPAVFEVKANPRAVHQVVTAQLAGLRRGTSSTKTRSEVRGGGKKPWRQKGTGRARAGSTRSPLWAGGGVVFGPHPRDHSERVPKKLKRLALRAILSYKAAEERLFVIDKLELSEPSTKKAKEILTKLNVPDKVTVVVGDGQEAVEKSIRNLPRARVLSASHVNPYELIDSEALLFTKEALDRVTEVLK